MRIALLAALTLLVAAPVAIADPPWSAPREIGSTARFISGPALAFTSSGAGVLAWNTGEPAVGHLATLRADGRVVERPRLGGEIVAGPLIRGGRTAVLTRVRRVTKRFRTLDTLAVRFGTAANPKGRVRRVGGTHEVFGEDQGPAIAVHGSEVAVAWVGKFGRERHRYRIAFSRGGGKFGTPQTLATTLLPTRDSESIALAYGSRGDLVAAYASRRRKPVIVQRTRRSSHHFGSEHVLGDRQPLTTLVAASNAMGRMVVAWGSQDSGEEASRPWIVRAAKRPGVSFGPAVVLDAGGAHDFAPRTVAAKVSNDGGTTVAWNNVTGPPTAETFPLRVATAPVGTWEPAREITPNGVLGGLALGHGNVLLSWTDDLHHDVFAAVRTGSFGAFEAAERVSSAAQEDRGPAVPAFAAGRPAVLWPVRLDATHTRLELSSR